MNNETRREAAIGLAVAAWLLALTAVWMPWWLVRYSDSAGNRYDAVGVWLWRPVAEVSNGWGPWVTGMLVAALALWLFVRLAGRSWEHEPLAWRRDLWVLAGLGGVALASTLAWPDAANFSSFWGGTTYTNTSTGVSFTERVLPGLGWWCMVLAAGCLVAAGALARRAGDASDK